jgi:uncharacterized protein (TIGR02996 family)
MRRYCLIQEEDVFLRQILHQPNDPLIRLVFADWLEEQNTSLSRTKAEYIRLELDWLKLNEKSPRKAVACDKLMRLAKEIETDWLAVVCPLPIELCFRRIFKISECPLR